MVRMRKIFQSSGMKIAVWWLVSLMITATFVAAGDMGLPGWTVPFLVLWVLTLGLPMVLSLVAASVLFGFVPTEGSVAETGIGFLALSLVTHCLTFPLLVRLVNWRKR